MQVTVGRLAFVADLGTQNFNLKTKFDMENNTSINHENGNDDNRLLAPVIFWQRFDQIKPKGDAEYLVCNTDGVIRVSYFDGTNWGYLSTVKENITHWSILPQVPVI